MKKLFKILAFALLCFLVIEQSYRVYVAGLVAFNPKRFDRINQLMLTDLIQPSEYPDVYFQLKPNLREWFRGAELRTNRFGLADGEYAIPKPEGVRRIAVAGSSWTMATGVEPDEAYHAVLETMLNEAFPAQPIEVVNFGVEMYGLGEIVATLRHRVPKWQPDMMIAAITTYTPVILWEERTERAPLPKPTHPFLQSYVLRALDYRLGTGIFPSAGATRKTVGNDVALYRSQILRAIREIGELGHRRGIPVAVIWLSFSPLDEAFEQLIRETAQQYGVWYIPAYRWILGTQDLHVGQQLNKMDKHPNARSHELLARGLFAELKKHVILTGDITK